MEVYGKRRQGDAGLGFEIVQGFEHKVFLRRNIAQRIARQLKGRSVGHYDFEYIAPWNRYHYSLYILVAVGTFTQNAEADIYFAVRKNDHIIIKKAGAREGRPAGAGLEYLIFVGAPSV